MNSAVREMLPPKRLIWANEIFLLEHFARLAQRQRHDVLVRLVRRAGMTSPISDGRRSALIGASTSSPRTRISSRSMLLRNLPDIARPVVRLQHRQRIVADAARPDAGLAGDLAS